MSTSQLPLFHVSRPATHGSEPYPALVLLHGLGANEQDLAPLFPHIDSRLYLLSLRAPLRYRWGGYSWFDYEREGPSIGGSSIGQSMNAITTFLQEFSREYPIDEKRVYVGGFSMGAAMVGALSLLQPGRTAGTIMLSGFLSPDTFPTRYRPAELTGHPIFLAHGVWDQVLPIAVARQTRDYLSRSPADLTYREYLIGHEINAEELEDVARWLRTELDARDTVAQP